MPIPSSVATKTQEYLDANQYQEALDCLQAYPEAEYTPELLFLRALAEYGLKDTENAKKDLQTLVKSEKGYPYADFTLAQICEQEGDTERAMYYYRRARKFRETYKEAINSLNFLKDSSEVDDSSARITDLKPFKPKTKFKDVIGLADAKTFLFTHVILAIQHPELFKKHGKRQGVGVLLFGPPGTGKTLIASAVAGEANAYMLITRINQLLGEFVGASEKNLSTIFKILRYNTPSILFMDELDALGSKRSSMNGGSDEHGGTSTMKILVNQLLTEMNGIESNPEGVFVIAATNAPWDIDSALKRSGRFGDAIYIPAPNYDDRKRAIKYYLKGKTHQNINIGRIARATMGYSMADIAKIMDDATMNPIAKEYLEIKEHGKSKGQTLTTSDILQIIKNTPNTLDPWYADTRKQLIGRFDVEVYDKKVHQKWHSGNLEADEKVQYKDLIKDILKKTNPTNIILTRLVRNIAIYLT